MSIPVNTNLYSTITIFKHSILTKDKNFALDKNGSNLAIEEYLATLQSETITNFQYVKQGLAISIKINKGQTMLSLIEDNDWNYCKIQNDKGSPCYYFIVKKEWLSKETISLTLVMDTLNTFAYNIDYIVNKKTTIQRQHKDRIKKLGEIEGSSLSATQKFGIPFDGSGYHVYPAGYIFKQTIPSSQDYTGSFTPTDVAKYRIKFFEGYAPDFQPTPLNPLPPQLEAIIDDVNGTYIIRCKEDYRVDSIDGHGYVIKFAIHPVTECYSRDVDLISEGINVPVYKKDLGQIEDETNNVTWFLLYRNRNAPDPEQQFNDSPVDCYLMPDHSINVIDNSDSKSLSTGNIASGKYYVFDANWDDGKEASCQFVIEGKTFTLSDTRTPSSFWEYATHTRYVLIVTSNGTQLSYQYVRLYAVYYDNGSVKSTNKVLLNSGTIPAGHVITLIYSYNSILPTLYNSNPYSSLTIDTYVYPDEADRISLGTASTIQSGNVTSIDRTDSRNIKLIALPYCPAQTEISGSSIRILNNFTYDTSTGWFKSNDVTTQFNNRFKTTLRESPFSTLLLKNLDLKVTNERDDSLESKLFHSDFYRPKFVYDSFNYNYYLERYDYSDYLKDNPTFPDLDYHVTFVMTRTINSKFLFKLDTNYLTHSQEDYDGLVAVARNNEEVLFNSAYINYVRSGFNYDKKTLARKQESAGWNIGLSIGSAILGIIGSVATQNPLPAILGVGAAGIGITGQIVSNIQTQAQGEQTIQQKLEEAERQAVAVAGSDDVDLLTAYSGNRAKLVLYDVSERMKKLIGDLFYYCGYKLDLQAVPDKDSRYWFNFVQCDLIVNYDSNVPSDIMNDLVERFKQGVTFFHYHDGFDLDQEKENLEVSLIN